MTSLPDWQDVWDGLNPSLSDLGAYVASKAPDVVWTIEHHDNEHFPLRAHLSFSGAGIAAQEYLVVAVDIRVADEELRWTSDIAHGDGAILAEGPTWTLAKAHVNSQRLGECLADSIAFLKSHDEIIVDQVRAASRAVRTPGRRLCQDTRDHDVDQLVIDVIGHDFGEWRPPDSLPLAVINRFESDFPQLSFTGGDDDGLGMSWGAAIGLPSGQRLGLLRHEHSSVPGLEVYLDTRDDPRAAFDEMKQALRLAPDEIVWVSPLVEDPGSRVEG